MNIMFNVYKMLIVLAITLYIMFKHLQAQDGIYYDHIYRMVLD